MQPLDNEMVVSLQSQIPPQTAWPLKGWLTLDLLHQLQDWVTQSPEVVAGLDYDSCTLPDTKVETNTIINKMGTEPNGILHCSAMVFISQQCENFHTILHKIFFISFWLCHGVWQCKQPIKMYHFKKWETIWGLDSENNNNISQFTVRERAEEEFGIYQWGLTFQTHPHPLPQAMSNGTLLFCCIF